MRPEDFTPAAAGRLIKSPEGAWAFVPAPLPPPIPPSWESANLVGQAMGELRGLAGIGHTLPNENLLLRPFLQREAVLSSRIEGTQTTLPELLLFDVEENGDESPDAQEVANYVEALNYGLNRLPSLPVSLPLLQEIHRILMQGVRGRNRDPGHFRRVQNWIGGATPHTARFVPPPVPEMMQALHDFERFIHAPSDLPFLVRLACLHYQFEAIHPFQDGNGRIGRLLLSLLLCSEGILPRPLLYLSGYFERNRAAYYDGLLHVSREGAWSAWLEFFLKGVVMQAQDATRRATNLLELRDQYRDNLQQQGASGAVLRLADEIFTSPALSMAYAQKRLGVSYRTARLSVEKLIEAGILVEATGRRRNRVFIAQEIVEAVEAEDI